MPSARTVHRLVMLLVVPFTLYISITGCLIQLVDLRALLTHAPAADPNMQAIRESIDGPPNFAVIGVEDYNGPALPAFFDADAALAGVLRCVQAPMHGQSIRYAEFRMQAAAIIGRIGAQDGVYTVDPAGCTTRFAPRKAGQGGPPQSSQHRSLKWLHRMVGDGYLWINIIVGIGLMVLVGTGLLLYGRMMVARARMERYAPFWSAASLWRSLHRSVAIVASLFVLMVAITGTWLSIDSFMLGFYRARHGAAIRAGLEQDTMSADQSAPLSPAQLHRMLQVTQAAFAKTEGRRPIEAVRLRSFAGMEQGVVITARPDVQQLIYDASNGRRVTETEPNYPPTAFPLGWQIHEMLKRVHRGDYFGLTGRLMDLLAGLSMAFLSVSGIVLYVQLWSARRRRGRAALVWAP